MMAATRQESRQRSRTPDGRRAPHHHEREQACETDGERWQGEDVQEAVDGGGHGIAQDRGQSL